MIKHFIYLGLLFFSYFSFSQTEIHELHFAELLVEDSANTKINFIEFHVFDHINSNSISNSFVNDFLYKGHISEEAKEATYDLQQNNNRMGSFFDYGITFKHQMNNGLIYSIRFRDINYRSMGYDSNLLKLALGGNKTFEDQTIELQDLNFKQRSIQELGFGLEKFSKDKKTFYGGSIGLLKTDYSRSLDIKNASFYTAPDGQEVEFTANINLQETGDNGSKYSRIEGLGASLNLYALKKIGNQHILELALTDLGFISTKSSTSLYQTDTTLDIKGVNLLNSGESSSSIANSEGIEEVFSIEEQQEKYNYVLPFFIRLNYKYYLDEKWTILSGLYYRYDENYIPKIFIKPGYNFNKNRSRIAPLLSYGGFSDFDLGISYYQKIAGDFYLTTDILYLEALLSPDNSTSQGFNLGVYSKF